MRLSYRSPNVRGVSLTRSGGDCLLQVTMGSTDRVCGTAEASVGLLLKDGDRLHGRSCVRLCMCKCACVCACATSYCGRDTGLVNVV